MKTERCPKCKGDKVIRMERELIPGFKQKEILPCDECHGTGRIIIADQLKDEGIKWIG